MHISLIAMKVMIEHKTKLVLHRKPCICDNFWCFAKQKNSSYT